MSVLVTGGAGFIGSYMVDGMIEEGHDVSMVDGLSTGSSGHSIRRVQFFGFGTTPRPGTTYPLAISPKRICLQ